MATESLIISAIVDEGATALRAVYAAGLSAESFISYEDEFAWIEQRLARNKPVNRRTFMERFGADFEFMRTDEPVTDLVVELREEVMLGELNALVMQLADTTKDNVVENTIAAREQLGKITRTYAPSSDVDLDANWQQVVKEMRQGQVLASQGESLGILTDISFLDHYWGGLLPGQFVQVLGRTGSAKSLFTMFLAWAARKRGHRVGIFSPELNDHEVRCRYHTIASADKDVQQSVGIQHSFRNRALMHRQATFNIKSYGRFCEHLDSMPGRMHLLSGVGMQDQMSVGYVEDRIVEHGLDLVIIDPIYLLKPVRTTKEGNIYQEVAWVAEKLHQVGESLNVPVVFTNQAHLDGNKDDAPGLDKSFGAKALLHLADYVLGVQHMSEEKLLIVRSNKSRFGESFRFQARFLPNTGYFEVLTPLVVSSSSSGDDEEPAKQDYVKGRV